MISTLVIVASAVTGFKLLFWTKRRIANLNFFVSSQRDASAYPLKVLVEIRNYTGSAVVIFAKHYVYKGGLRRDPNARGDTATGEHELKFPERTGVILQEVEYLLRHRESVCTWVPIDPTHTDQEVDAALKHKNVAELHLTCTWLREKPTVDKLRVPI
jgi:hypothetical protein